MLKEKLEQRKLVFQEKVGMNFDYFKEITLPETTRIYLKSVTSDTDTNQLMEKFIDKAYEEVLLEILSFDKNTNFYVFFANMFCLNVNRELYRYRLDHDFTGPNFIHSVIPADIVLALKTVFDGK